MTIQREESIIFNELTNLCTSPGYAHVIAYFCYRDNTTWVSEQFGPENIQEHHKQESLIRTEISTLVGLLVKNELNLIIPSQENIAGMIAHTETLLKELHLSLSQPMQSHLNDIAQNVLKPFRNVTFLSKIRMSHMNNYSSAYIVFYLYYY